MRQHASLVLGPRLSRDAELLGRSCDGTQQERCAKRVEASCLILYFRRIPLNTKLYVGKLSYSVNKDGLERMFASYGAVRSAEVIMDRESGRSKGFGFVEMSSPAEAQAAIAALNGKNEEGRSLIVNEARPLEPRRTGSDFGGRSSGQRNPQLGQGRNRV